MNTTKEVRGIGRVVGELLCAVPDVGEALDRFDAISTSLARHLGELADARRQERMAVLAIQADLEMFAQEVASDKKEWKTRRDEIALGASDLAIQMPGNPLGFRVVSNDLPYSNGGFESA